MSEMNDGPRQSSATDLYERTRELRAEIRDLNDALTQALELRSDLAALKAQPFVPLADHRRVIDQRDQALLAADGLTRELASLRDARGSYSLDRALVSLGQLVRQLERIGGYSTDRDQAELREARAVLVEVEK